MIRLDQITPILLLLASLFAGCTDKRDSPQQPPIPESQRILERFGSAMGAFTQSGIQALLDNKDRTNPITLLQLTAVQDAGLFAEFDRDATQIWEAQGATVHFASTSFAQMLGERPMDEVRLIRFPNIAALLRAIDSTTFTSAMDKLYLASSDLTWVLGVEQDLTAPAALSFIDPRLQGIDENQAKSLLGIPEGVEPPPPAANILAMIASDKPSPFWMVNLIEFREYAEYDDGRDSTLSGREANAVYADLILPQLAAFNSTPGYTMDVHIILSNESFDWDSAAIVRYASRDAFLNIFPLNPASPAALAHKNAGIANTQVYATEVASEVIAPPQSGPLYNLRYCEVLLINLASGALTADVYNSMGLNHCPQEQWDALDAVAIAQEFEAMFAVLNGVRFWVLDGIQNTSGATEQPVRANFGGIDMFLAASVDIATSGDGEPANYRPNRVSRNTIFHYVAGRQVYELTDPDGTRFMMQSFTQGVDRNQQLVDLQFLGERLNLPPDWQFNARILTQNFALPSVDGIAEVITDDLGNTYQRVP
jgi:hypothetical protein